VNVAYAALRVERAARELTETLGREPTEEEIAAEARVPARKVPKLMATPQEPLSLDAAAPSAEEEEIVGFHIADEAVPDPLREAVRGAEREMLHGLLDHLPARERLVLRERMGFEDGRTWTLREIAEQLQVSREAVRRIELSALRRLRSVAPAWMAAG
jgi:RNA polymerase primary sigma factor